MRHGHAGQAGGAVFGPQAVRFDQLRARLAFQRCGQHHDAVLEALAFAHDDGAAVEIDVLHAQTQAFHQAHASAVEQLGQQAVRAAVIQRREHKRDLVMRQHHRQPALRLRATDLVHPRHGDVEHLLVQEEQRRQRLAVRGRRDLAFGGQHGDRHRHRWTSQTLQ